MGLFGDDEKQDEWLDALERHIRTLTEAVHGNRVDTAACWAGVLRLQDDNQTRSMLQTDQQFPGLDNNKEGLQMNADGTVDVYFKPEAPSGKEANWIQTVPGKGWNMLFRLYGPLQPWFDKTWRLPDPELVE